MRLFIGIPLPPDIRRAVWGVKTALEAHGARGRFVPAENYHITLHFLGETEALGDAAEAVRGAARDIRPFLARLGGYGAFGGDGAHTGYVTVSCEGGELQRLYESLSAALWERGLAGSRAKFTPHITLGRMITGDAAFAAGARLPAFTAGEVILFESRFIDGGMRYTAVHRERFT